jgi:hypothetical protein
LKLIKLSDSNEKRKISLSQDYKSFI